MSFRECRIKDGSGNDVTNNTSHVGYINPLRYRGYYYDIESGLYYLQSRYYNPEVGRFLNADGLVSTEQGLLAHNMFAYCNNNCVMRYDESGYESIQYLWRVYLESNLPGALNALGWKFGDDKINQMINTILNYDIKTPDQVAHFLAQLTEESGRGEYTEEINEGYNYEYRADLGNTQPGDGHKYKGGGYIQVTGRANYQQMAIDLGDPNIMEGYTHVSIECPWDSVYWYWKKLNINTTINQGSSVKDVTYNLQNRINNYNIAKPYFN